MADSVELKRLADLPRSANDSLRISLDSYTDPKGGTHRYLSLRVWYRTEDGSWRPTKKGVTVRQMEILDVGKALRAGLDALNGESSKPAPPPNRDPFDMDQEDAHGLF